MLKNNPDFPDLEPKIKRDPVPGENWIANIGNKSGEPLEEVRILIMTEHVVKLEMAIGVDIFGKNIYAVPEWYHISDLRFIEKIS